MSHIAAFFGLPLQMRYIVAFHWTAAIDLAFCGVLQWHYINRRNTTVVEYKTAAIYIFLRRFFLVIVAVLTAKIDLLIVCIWSNVSLHCFGLNAILAFHFPPFIFQYIPLLLALRKNPLSLSLSFYKHFHHQSFTTRH